MSNFTETAAINLLAGNPTDAHWDALERQYTLIAHELQEMRESLDRRDMDGLRDDIGDVLFTTYGMGHRAGFPVDEDYAEVCRSNWTKFDITSKQATATQEKYLQLGIKTFCTLTPHPNTGQVLYVTRSVMDQVGSDTKSYPKGKWLKSVNFEEPSYRKIERELPIYRERMLKAKHAVFTDTLIAAGVLLTPNIPNDVPTVNARVLIRPVAVDSIRWEVEIEGEFYCDDPDPYHTATVITRNVYRALYNAPSVVGITHIVHQVKILDEDHGMYGTSIAPDTFAGEGDWVHHETKTRYPFHCNAPKDSPDITP